MAVTMEVDWVDLDLRETVDDKLAILEQGILISSLFTVFFCLYEWALVQFQKGPTSGEYGDWSGFGVSDVEADF